MSALTLASAVANAQRVFNKPQDFCLNRDFQADPDLSHKATIEELREKMKALPETEGAIKKLRLKAILGLLYPAPKFEGRVEKFKKSEAKPFTNFIKQAAAMCKVSLISNAALYSSSLVVKLPAKPALSEKGIGFCNQIKGDFDLMPWTIKRLIAAYTGDFESTDRFNFGECYPDLCYNELLEKIGLKERLTMEELIQLYETLKDRYRNFCKKNLEGNYEVVFTHCKNLKELWVRGNFREEDCQILASLPPNIIVCFDGMLSDEKLKKFAENFRGVYGIKLKCCRVSAIGLEALAENCKELQELYIDSCVQITSSCLQKLSSCKNLRILALLNCHFLNNDTLLHGLANWKNLQKLILRNSDTFWHPWRHITTEVIPKLKKLLPNLKEVIILDYK